jgi:hypothetical protein
MTNARRRLAIRAIMAETGMNYTAALRELARRVAAADAARLYQDKQPQPQEEREDDGEHATRLRLDRAPADLGPAHLHDPA